MQDAMKTSWMKATESAPSRYCRTARVILIACAWPSWMMAGHPAARGESETVVRLLSSAVVNTDEVALRDVAEIKGESAELIGGWSIGAAPRVGSTGVVES